MPVEVQFQRGSKPLLTTLLSSIKDFLPTSAANLIFTPRGLALRFASGRNTDSRVVVACHLDAEANHRPFTFTRNGPMSPSGMNSPRRSSVGHVQYAANSSAGFDDVKSESGDSAFSMPEGKIDREKHAQQVSKNGLNGMYGIIGKYVCQKEAVLVGFSPQLMIEQLKLVDLDDTVTIRAEESEDGSVQIYEMYIESQDLTRKCLYEVDAIPLIDRFVPLPDIQFSMVCQIKTTEFTRIVDALHGTSDKIVIIANKNSITFCASGSDGTLQVGLVQKPGTTADKMRFKVLSFQAPVKHVVDSRLLKGFTTAAPLSPHVLLFLPPTPSATRPAAPIRVTFEISVVELPGGNVVLASEFDPAKHLPTPPTPTPTNPLFNTPTKSHLLSTQIGRRHSVAASGWRASEKQQGSSTPEQPTGWWANAKQTTIPENSATTASVSAPQTPSASASETKTFASVASSRGTEKNKEKPKVEEPSTPKANSNDLPTAPSTPASNINTSPMNTPNQQGATTPPPTSGFLGITAPRNSTPVGVHASGHGMSVNLHDEGSSSAPSSSVTNAPPNTTPTNTSQEEIRLRVVGQLHYLLAPELGAIIAPGLSLHIRVKFTPPLTQSNSEIKDFLKIQAIFPDHSCQILTLELLAATSAPNLRFSCDELDFGVLINCSGCISDPTVSKTVAFEGEDRNKNLAIDFEKLDLGVWDSFSSVKYVTITNLEKRDVDVSIPTDVKLPFRISPSTISLTPHRTPTSSASLKISYLPLLLGKFYHTISIPLVNSPLPPTINLLGKIISHKLSLRKKDGTQLSNSETSSLKIDFGGIYFSQNACFETKLENQSGEVVNWVITTSGESSPNVPTILNKSTQASRIANVTENLHRGSITVSPSEGSLNPFESTFLTFTFSPAMILQTRGWSSSTVDSNSHASFRVSMQLKIINSSSKISKASLLRNGEDPIDILLTGDAYPILATMCNPELKFENQNICQRHDDKNNYEQQRVKLLNKSSKLPFIFKFQQTAHFVVSPAQGIVYPNSAVEIEVVFKPRQLGQLNTIIKCAIFASSSAIQHAVTELDLNVFGTCTPLTKTILPSPYQQEKRLLLVVPNKLDEWIKKTTHRHHYHDYLVSHRKDRLQRLVFKHFGRENIVEFGETSSDEFFDCEGKEIDIETGLSPPEPILQDFGSSALSCENQIKASKKFAQLLDQLLSPDAFLPTSKKQPAPPNTATSFKIDTQLTPSELKKIFAATDTIEFGTVTVHSENTFNLKFLNALSDRTKRNSIHITMLPSEFEQIASTVETKSLQELTVSPYHQIVAPQTISTFEVKYKCDTLQTDKIRKQFMLKYLINGRYKYSIPVSVTVVPVDLQISIDEVNMDVTPDMISKFVSNPNNVDDNFKELDDSQQKQFKSSQEKLVFSFTQTFDVKNFGNVPTKFTCSFDIIHAQQQQIQAIPTDGYFTVSPMEATIPPNSSATLSITYFPGVKPATEDVLSIAVSDIYTQKSCKIINIPCKASFPTPNCTFLPVSKHGPMLDLGVVPVYAISGNQQMPNRSSVNTRANSPGKQIICDNNPISIFYDTELLQNNESANKTTIPVSLPPKTSQAITTKTVKLHNFSNFPCCFFATVTKNYLKKRISNAGSTISTAVACTPSSVSELRLSQQYGIISPSQTLEFTIKISSPPPKRVGVFEDVINFSFLGGGVKTLKVPVRYESKVPVIEVEYRDENREIDSEVPKVIIGSSYCKDFVVKNYGSVSGRVLVDLRQNVNLKMRVSNLPLVEIGTGSFLKLQKKKSISFDEDLNTDSSPHTSSAEKSRKPQLQKSTPSKFSTPAKQSQNLSTTLQSRIIEYTELSPTRFFNYDGKYRTAQSPHWISIRKRFLSNPNISQSRDSECKPNRFGKLYLLEILPNECLACSIIWTPTSISEINVELPIHVLSTNSPSCIALQLQSIQSPITISKPLINFKNKVIHRTDAINSSSSGIITPHHHNKTYKEKFTITNNYESKSLEWIFDVSVLETLSGGNNVFRIDPVKGCLGPSESATISVFFQTNHMTGKFTAKVPLHLEFSEIPQLYIELKANGVEPSLIFEPREIFLGIVPISFAGESVVTTHTFSILNFGCERTEVLVTNLGCNEGINKRAEIELLFPEGKLLKSDGEKLPVVLKLTTKPKPVTAAMKNATVVDMDLSINFLVKIEFRNSEGQSFFVPVRGGVDNSVMSLQHFLFANKDEVNIQISDDDGPVTLAKCAGKNIVRGADGNFHKRLIALVNQLRRKKTPGGINLDDKNMKIVQSHLYHQGTTLMRWFSKNVPKSDMNTSSSQSLDDNEEQYCSNPLLFEVVSMEAWVTLFLQLVRVFICQPLVSVQHYKQLPNICDDFEWPIKSDAISFYNTPETLLLRWFSHHTYKNYNVKKRLSNFSGDFKDSKPLMSAFVRHIPSLEHTHFKNFHHDQNPNPQQLQYNAEKVCTALKDILNVTILSPSAIVNGNTLELFLLANVLYQTLPQFIPRGTIVFDGELHQKVTKHVELSNSTKKPITYTCRIKGSNEFTTSKSTLTIPPKAQMIVPIDLICRFVRKPAEAQIKFFNTDHSGSVALNEFSLVIFDLKANVCATQRALKKFRVETPMYSVPPVGVNVEVVNPFTMQGKFLVTLSQSRIGGGVDEVIPLSFQTAIKEISLDIGGSGVIPVTFLPFDMGTFQCTLHFVDEKVGEFTYEIEGKSTAPLPFETFSGWNCKCSDILEKSIRLNPINTQRDKAVSTYLAIISGNASKNIPASKQQQHSIITSAEREACSLPKTSLKYRVDYSSPHFTGPREVVIKSSINSGKEKTAYAIEQCYSELLLQFSPKIPGKYSCRITLTCLEFPDVRVLTIYGSALSEDTYAELEFTCPCRQTISQEIPIINKSADDWTLKAMINGRDFSGPFMITALSHSTTYYTLNYNPITTSSQANLLLLNLNKSQKHHYTLKGIAEPPLAESIFEIECKAREKKFTVFPVKNYGDDDAEFEVFTDLPNVCDSNGKILRVKARETVDYKLEFCAKMSGLADYVVKFVNKTDLSYLWYSIKLKVQKSSPEEILNLQAAVRKAVAISISLKNPLSKPISYRTNIVGEGLYGEEVIQTPRQSEACYLLTFAPVHCGKQTGSLTFFNSEIGEFWYELNMEASPSPPNNLPEMSCPLGKCCLQTIVVANPLSHNVILEVQLSNNREFQIVYPAVTSTRLVSRNNSIISTIRLRALETTEIQIAFWPSSLTETSTSTLEILSNVIGNSTYCIKGRGLFPETMDEITVESELNELSTTSITFTNPFIDPIPLKIYLKHDHQSNSEIFSLIQNKQSLKNTQHLGGLESIRIPIIFSPKEMKNYKSNLIFEMDQKIKWVYPINGVSEITLTAQQINIEGHCKELLEKHIELHIPKSIQEKNEVLSKSDFTLSLGSKSASALTYIQNDLKFDVKNLVPKGDGVILYIQVLFAISKPQNAHLHLKVNRNFAGVIWKFPLHIICHPAPVDDMIIIEGTPNKVSSASFSVKNTTDTPCSYTAYFQDDSGAEFFQVYPESGILLPDSEKPDVNKIVLNFKPSAYGKTIVKHLIVETKNKSWTFEVRGVTPHHRFASGGSRYSYSATGSSQSGSGRKQNENPAGVRKNFVRENLKIKQTTSTILPPISMAKT
ncbi:Cilia- and flagella-associated protein 47 [Nowakowskiella sp. JEL0407]|nr:Cilia- and flagella-associated protein 47 [Nowakowskiella sp. JEL0407]